MLKNILLTLSFILLSLSSMSQEEALFQSILIPSELIEKSNSVVRYDVTNIEVKAYNKYIYTKTRLITILNKKGNDDHGAAFQYDSNTNIKKLEVKVFDAFGKELKKIKKNDFQDVSAVSGSTLYSDTRFKYLDYTPITYPYSILLETEIEYNSTAFFPSWMPLDGFYSSTQFSEYKISNESDVDIKIKTSNFENYAIEKHSDFHYSAKNLKSLKPESYSPSFRSFAPYLKVALKEFEMEGVKGVNSNWQDFGKWMHDRLLVGTEVLPEAVKSEIKSLVQGATSDREKAKVVYNYMQNKTRYISVQIGIGGWKPMLAEDVDRLGYADCKGLSNYTKALLKEVGVEANYAVIYGARNITNIDSEFSATEGNHAVLCIPSEKEEDYIWLECTSQTNPFGYIANWTDDRDALVITPDGGKIVHTTSYSAEESLQHTTASILFSKEGAIDANVTIKTSGYQYALHEGIQTLPSNDQELNLKEYWDYINDLNITSMVFENDKDNVVFTEKVALSAKNYAAKSGKRFLFEPNIFNKVTGTPTRYKKRTLDFEIDRGFTDQDEFIITIDGSLEIEAQPKDITVKNKFGSYSFSIEKVSETELLYKRTYSLNKGYYPKEEYKAFRDFIANVVKLDKSKIVLISKS